MTAVTSATSTARPPRRCTRRPARCCSPRSTGGTPTRAGCTAPAATARLLLDNAREATADALGVRPDEVTFTASRHRRGAPGAARAGPRVARAATSSSTPRSSTPRCGTPSRGARAAIEVARRRATAASTPASSRRAAAPEVGVVALQSANHEVGTVQPVGRARRCPTTSRSSPTPAPRWAACRCPTAGPPPPARRTSGAGPAGVGVLLVRKRRALAQPVPRRRPGRRALDRLRERPGRPRRGRRAAGRGGRARRGQRAPARARRRRTPPGGRRGARRRGRRRPRATTPPPGDVLLPLRRRRGARHRARPSRLRDRERLGLHRLDAHAEPRAGGDGRAHPRQRPALAAARRHPRATSTPSATRCPRSSPRSGRGWGCEPAHDGPTSRSSSTAATCRARCRSSSSPGTSPTSRSASCSAVVAHDAGRRASTYRRGAG